MNTTHVHLRLNHIPILGSAVGLGLLAFAMWRPSEAIKRVALGVMVLAALFVIPVDLSGEPPEDGVAGLPGVSKALIEQHEEAAELALGGLPGVGALALASTRVAPPT